jgi:hypothetical protein
MQAAVFVCGRALSWRSTILHVSIPRLLFLIFLPSFYFLPVSQYTSEVIVVSCYMNPTISTPFLSQTTVTIGFLAGTKGLFKLFRLVW